MIFGDSPQDFHRLLEVEPGKRGDFDLPRWYRIVVSLNNIKISRVDSENFTKTTPVAQGIFANGGKRRTRSLVNLWLPKKQKRFQGEALFQSMKGPAASEVLLSTQLEVLRSGKKYPVFISASPEYLHLGAVMNGQMIPDLLATPPAFQEESLGLSGWFE